MGFKEEYINDWTGKIIDYQGKIIVIAKEIEYNGTKYLYGITKDSLYTDDVKITFLHKIKEDIFAHVTDENTINALVKKLDKNYMIDEVKEALENK